MLTVDFARLRLRRGSRLLDLGCGEGRHARATRLLPGVATVACDVAAAEIDTAAQSLRAMESDGAAFPAASDCGPWLAVRGDTYRLPFDDESFDCIIAAEVLEHLEHDGKALDEIHRVLKPGGELVVSVPRFGPEIVCWALSSAYRNSPGGHVRIYRRSRLAGLIAAKGFELYDAHFAHALHTPYWWLKCAVGLERTGGIVALYHRFLVWDMFAQKPAMRLLERVLDPVIGKSEVFYARKPALVRQFVPRRMNAGFAERVAAVG